MSKGDSTSDDDAAAQDDEDDFFGMTRNQWEKLLRAKQEEERRAAEGPGKDRGDDNGDDDDDDDDGGDEDGRAEKKTKPPEKRKHARGSNTTRVDAEGRRMRKTKPATEMYPFELKRRIESAMRSIAETRERLRQYGIASMFVYSSAPPPGSSLEERFNVLQLDYEHQGQRDKYAYHNLDPIMQHAVAMLISAARKTMPSEIRVQQPRPPRPDPDAK